MILYGMLMLAVPMALPLGMGFAAMGALLAVKSGSVLYLPVGAAILLAGLALLHGRSTADLVMLALVVLALAAGWLAGSDGRSWMLRSLVELSGRIELMLGLLVIMVAAILFAHWYRLFSGQARRARLAAAYVR